MATEANVGTLQKHAPVQAAAENFVQLRNAALHDARIERRVVLGRDQPWKDIHPPVADPEIVIAAAIMLAAIFEDAQAAALGAIGGRQLLQQDHGMGDAVHGLVAGVGRLDGGLISEPISGAAARRLCCDASVIPVVLGGAGEILDVGRARRTATRI